MRIPRAISSGSEGQEDVNGKSMSTGRLERIAEWVKDGKRRSKQYKQL